MSRSWRYRAAESSCHLLRVRADCLGDKVSPWAVWLYCTEWCIGERVARVCIWLHCICLYIRFIPSCRICDVIHSVFSVYVHLMYIFLSLFLCGWLLLCYTVGYLYYSVAALLIITSIVLHRTWGVTAGIRATRFKTCGLGWSKQSTCA